jgi:hypothetical protein
MDNLSLHLIKIRVQGTLMSKIESDLRQSLSEQIKIITDVTSLSEISEDSVQKPLECPRL